MPEITGPTRHAALARLHDFAPRMGRDYASGRNADPGPGLRRDVARLSPHVRHRLLLEEELVGTALAHHGVRAAEKFVQEVFWRSYWKGFLELRPAMWRDYRWRVAADRAALATNGGLRKAYEAAAQGASGIACFDAWVAELREEGWLHNHARMWFASIWIFTLRLPWTLGADLFLRHLKDADAASNTLSWRWVGGIQTPGKHYLARAENIARFTKGRFDPRGELDEAAEPLAEPGPPPPGPLPPADDPPRGPCALLLHEDDLHPEDLPPLEPRGIAGFCVPERRSPMPVAEGVRAFIEAALDDGLARAGRVHGLPAAKLRPGEVADWAAGLGVPSVATPYAPAGWTAEALEEVRVALADRGIRLHRLRRPWDEACWPLARKGFFPFRESIPGLIRHLDPQPPNRL
jgi:deoxyribodipyrimidine photo-lyase